MAMSPSSAGHRTRALALVGFAAIAFAACGTTVPQTTQLDANGGGSVLTGTSGAAAGSPAAGSAAAGSGTGSTAGDQAATTSGTAAGSATSTGGSAQVGSVGTGPVGAAAVGTATAAPTGVTRSGSAVAGGGKTGPSTGAAKGATATRSATPKAGAGGATKAAAPAATTGPLQLGFLDTETGNASNLGLNTGMTYSYPDIINGLVKAVNASGGIAGRQIQPVIATTDTAGTNWSTEFQAACSSFTQDNHVAAVLGYEFIFLANFEQCLAQAGIPHLNEAYLSGGNSAFTTYPELFSLAAPSVDRIDLLNLAGPLADGELTTKNKIGIVGDSCGDDESAYNNTMLPYIKAHGLDLAASVTLACSGGSGDSAGGASTVSSAVLNFRSEGVDRVIVSGVPAVVFAEEAQSQAYFPDYLLTSEAGGGLIGPNVPAQQAANMHGYGWLPEVDVDSGHQPAQTPPEKKCLSLLASQSIVPSQFGDYFPMYTTCDALFAYQAAVAADGGKTDGASVTSALAGLGGGYPSVTTLNNASLLSPSHHDDPTTYQPWKYNTGCSCFTYIESAQPFPTS